MYILDKFHYSGDHAMCLFQCLSQFITHNAALQRQNEVITAWNIKHLLHFCTGTTTERQMQDSVM